MYKHPATSSLSGNLSNLYIKFLLSYAIWGSCNIFDIICPTDVIYVTKLLLINVVYNDEPFESNRILIIFIDIKRIRNMQIDRVRIAASKNENGKYAFYSQREHINQ